MPTACCIQHVRCRGHDLAQRTHLHGVASPHPEHSAGPAVPASCMAGSLKQFPVTQVFTYNAQDWGEEGNSTQGGYSNYYVIDNRRVLFLPKRK